MGNTDTKTIIHLIKDAVKIDMGSVHSHITSSHSLTVIKTNNCYFEVSSKEISKTKLTTGLVEELKSIITKYATTVEKLSGDSIDKVCSYINTKTISLFFEISCEDKNIITVERVA